MIGILFTGEPVSGKKDRLLVRGLQVTMRQRNPLESSKSDHLLNGI